MNGLRFNQQKGIEMKTEQCERSNKDRFCKTMASVAFIDTYIQRDLRLQTKEIPSSGNSKQTKAQSFSETQVAISLVVHSRNGFLEQT